jgi:hypothetical protein
MPICSPTTNTSRASPGAAERRRAGRLPGSRSWGALAALPVAGGDGRIQQSEAGCSVGS